MTEEAPQINPEALERLVELKKEEDRLDAELKALKSQSATLADALLEQFLAGGVQNVKTKSGATVFVRSRTFYGLKEVPEETKIETEQRVEKILDETGLEALVAHKTVFDLAGLASYIDEQEQIGGTVDPRLSAILERTPKHQLSVRRR